MAQNTLKPMTHREYFYTLDEQGNLIHDGAILDDPLFVDFFFRRLRENDSGRCMDYNFYAPCGSEWNYLAAADTPIVFTRFNGSELGYAGSLTYPFRASDLRFGENGVVYHASPLGVWARLHRNVALELAKQIEPWGPWYAYTNPHTGRTDVVQPLSGDNRYEFLPPREGNACAGCGEDNPFSLRLSFLYDKEKQQTHTWLRPSVQLMGSLNIMHGGFVALLLDETMGKVLSAGGIKAPTAQLNVRYRRPVPINDVLHVSARVARVEGRKHTLHSQISLAHQDDIVLAESEALFIAIKQTMHSTDESSLGA